jgi:hypothetical protein
LIQYNGSSNRRAFVFSKMFSLKHFEKLILISYYKSRIITVKILIKKTIKMLIFMARLDKIINETK